MLLNKESWPQEALRRALERIANASEGERHNAVLAAAGMVADYVAKGELDRTAVESQILTAAVQKGFTGARYREALRCIEYSLGKGDASKAWYPGRPGRAGRYQFRWNGGKIHELELVAPPMPPLPTVKAAEKVRLTWFDLLKDTQGEAYTWPWTELAEAVEGSMAWPEGGKAGLPLWSFAEFKGDNRAAGSELGLIHALVLDYDDEPDWSTDAVREWWGAVQYVAHSTSSHNMAKGQHGAHPRGRVIVALSRPVTEEEYHALGAWAVNSGRGVISAKELKNARQAYYVPARAPGGYERSVNLVGKALDVDAVLAAPAEPEAPEVGVYELLTLRKDGIPHSNLHNLVEIFQHDQRWKGRITFCEFSYRELIDGREIEKRDESDLSCWLTKTYGMVDVPTAKVGEALNNVAHKNRVHAVRDYLNALPEWDGEERLDAWLRYAGVTEDDGLNAVYGRKWMISAVARALDPGCQVDSALILAGPKGLGKTSTFRILAGLRWHAESVIAIGEKEAYANLQGVWIYELGELDSMRRAEVSAVKQYITARQDNYRPVFERRNIIRKRQNVFAGTTNDGGFLKEPDRRWWVRQVRDPADLRWLEEHRDQLWAEAVHRYQAGEAWHLNAEEQVRQDEDVQQYTQEESPWTGVVAEFVTGRAVITVPEILERVIKLDLRDMEGHLNANKVGKILRSLGWEREMIKGGPLKGRMQWRPGRA